MERVWVLDDDVKMLHYVLNLSILSLEFLFWKTIYFMVSNTLCWGSILFTAQIILIKMEKKTFVSFPGVIK